MYSRLLFLLLVVSPFFVRATEDSVYSKALEMRKNNLSVSVTLLTSDYLLLGNHFGTTDYKNKGPVLGVAASYSRNLAAKHQLGLTSSFEQQYGDWQKTALTYTYKYGNTYMSYPVGKFFRKSFTIAVQYSYDYVLRKSFRMYMVAGVGFTVNSIIEQYNLEYYNKQYQSGINQLGPVRTNTSNNHFNGYYSPVGFAAGRDFSWFLELGFGYKGVMNTGINYKFS